MSSINALNGEGSGNDMIEKAKMYTDYLAQIDGEPSSSSEFKSGTTPSDDASPIASLQIEKTTNTVPSFEDINILHTPSENMSTVEQVLNEGNEKLDLGDDDKDGIPNYLDASSPLLNEAALDNLTTQLNLDSDGDGVLDFLDPTGSDSRIEQMYDEEAALKQENVRAFISLLSMLNNLDLTRISGDQFKENSGDALTVMVMAGMAQRALMHSDKLQEPPQNIIVKKQDIKKLANEYKNQTKKARYNDVITLSRLVNTLPPTEPKKPVLQKACQSVLARMGNANVAMKDNIPGKEKLKTHKTP
ncbi:MAG: hypothetical protein LBN94_00430 [Puniceicoccales bacterium]|jgi:hypothetical protein|nr:hypothetical protein [Puniceicoccales bacterium]